jgi:cell division protein FtsA
MKIGDRLLLIDPGYKHIRLGVLLFKNEAAPDLVYTESYESAGMNCGRVSSMDDFSNALRKAIEATRKESGFDSFAEIWVGHSGSHIGCDNVTEEDTLRNNTPVSRGLEKRLMKDAEKRIPGDAQLIHSFKQFTLLDGVRRDNVKDLIGSKIASRYHIVYSMKSVISNLRNAFGAAGMKPSYFLFNGYTASIAVGHREEFNLGCLVIHLGHTTVDYIVYQEGQPFLTGSVNDGWSNVIRDVAMELKISESDAEKAIFEYGVAHDLDTRQDMPLNIPNMFGETLQPTRRNLAQAMHARIIEVFTSVCDRLRDTICRGHIPGGIYLTGGGALTRGIAIPAMEVFGVHTRVGYPVLVQKGREYDPSWATILGMTREASGNISPVRIPHRPVSRAGYYLSDYLGRMFPRKKDKHDPESEPNK